jgi:tyrosyl-DNA phosphodiesterase-1
MMTGEAEDVAPAKRRRLNDDLDDETAFSGEPIIYKGLDRPISPPLTKRKSPTPAAILTPDWGFHNVRKQNSPSAPATGAADASQQTGISPQEVENEGLKIIPSPVQLTKIEDLVSHQNVDTVELKEILGDPLIQECWNFNFLFDLEFVM